MADELDLCIRARYPLLYIVTYEEQRALDQLEKLCVAQKKKLFVWSFAQGLYNVALPERVDTSQRDPQKVLATVISAEDNAIYVLADYHHFLKDPGILRLLREARQKLKPSHKTLVILSPVLEIPPDLEKDVTVVDFAIPSFDEVAQIVDAMLEALQERGNCNVSVDAGTRERLIKAGLGLTIDEVENALNKAIVMHKGLTAEAVATVAQEKRQIIRKSGVLEFYQATEQMGDLGGLTELKEWLRKRTRAFSEKARAFGLPEPKGLLMVGVQGCGKSLTAKAVGSLWRLPLLRLDIGRLFSGVVGSSEHNMRTAITVAESLSPVILWVDEIEKGMAGVGSSNFSDAGTAARVFGSFVTWLQEKQKPVFVIATANDVSQLPPELIRKGRFDEIFFVDLPREAERREIFDIHLRKRNRNPEDFDLETLAAVSEGYSGSEIEQAIIAGLYDAFDEDRPLTTPDIERNVKKSVPLSQTMAERIGQLREWAKYRARPAAGAG